MSITFSKKNLREVRNSCLTKDDVKTVGELSQKMLTAKSDYEVIAIAKEIVATSRRNEIALKNEQNISVLYDYIASHTSKGDYITRDSIVSGLFEENLFCTLDNGCAAFINAIPIALRRLERDGYIKPKKVARRNSYTKSGRTIYKNVYEVI